VSIFASYVQDTIPIPWDPPHTVTIQKLSGRALRKAAQANLVATVESLKDMGGAAFQKELSAIGDPTAIAAAVAQSQADPLTQYESGAVLRAGVVSWTYDRPKTDEALADLDEQSEELLARAILTLSLPPRTEDAKKKASEPSTEA